MVFVLVFVSDGIDIGKIKAIFFCPINVKSCGVSGFALFFTGCLFDNLFGYGSFCCFNVAGIAFANAFCCYRRIIFAPNIIGFVPIMSRSIDILNIFCLNRSPFCSKFSSICGGSVSGTGGTGRNFAGGFNGFGFFVFSVNFTDTLCSTFFIVPAPEIFCFFPIMSIRIDINIADYCFGFAFCPINIKGCSIFGIALCGASSLFNSSGSYGCFCLFNMSIVVFTDTLCKIFGMILAPFIGCFIPIMSDCVDIGKIKTIVFCPINIKSCGVSGFAIFFAGCFFDNLCGYGSFCCFNMAVIVPTNAFCNTCAVSFAPAVFSISPSMSIGIYCNISGNKFCCTFCPINIKGCGIFGIAFFSAGRFVYNFGADNCIYSFDMLPIVSTFSLCNAGFSVIAPFIRSFLPAMSGCIDIFKLFCLVFCPGRGKICNMLGNTFFFTGRFLCCSYNCRNCFFIMMIFIIFTGSFCGTFCIIFIPAIADFPIMLERRNISKCFAIASCPFFCKLCGISGGTHLFACCSCYNRTCYIFGYCLAFMGSIAEAILICGTFGFIFIKAIYCFAPVMAQGIDIFNFFCLSFCIFSCKLCDITGISHIFTACLNSNLGSCFYSFFFNMVFVVFTNMFCSTFAVIFVPVVFCFSPVMSDRTGNDLFNLVFCPFCIKVYGISFASVFFTCGRS